MAESILVLCLPNLGLNMGCDGPSSLPGGLFLQALHRLAHKAHVQHAAHKHENKALEQAMQAENAGKRLYLSTDFASRLGGQLA